MKAESNLWERSLQSSPARLALAVALPSSSNADERTAAPPMGIVRNSATIVSVTRAEMRRAVRTRKDAWVVDEVGFCDASLLIRIHAPDRCRGRRGQRGTAQKQGPGRGSGFPAGCRPMAEWPEVPAPTWAA